MESQHLPMRFEPVLSVTLCEQNMHTNSRNEICTVLLLPVFLDPLLGLYDLVLLVAQSAFVVFFSPAILHVLMRKTFFHRSV